MQTQTLYWNGEKSIRDFINQLINLEEDGYTKIGLMTEMEEFDLETEAGNVEYEEVAKLLII